MTYDIRFLENIVYVTAKHGDKSVPDSPEERLDNFSTFSIYQILPQLIELWGLNIKSEEVPKKSKTNRKTNDYTLVFTKGSGTWSFCF